jgi:hypothetical protein
MSYEAIADLAKDQDFISRLSACLCEESAPKTDDLSTTILRNPSYGAQLFMPLVSAAPGFAVAYEETGQKAITDAMLLSAVQADWDRVSTLLAPPPA